MKMDEWAHQIIYGVGGLLDFEKYELAAYRGCPDKREEHSKWTPNQTPGGYLCWAAHWTLECLTNPEYAEVLEAVNQRATERRQIQNGP